MRSLPILVVSVSIAGRASMACSSMGAALPSPAPSSSTSDPMAAENDRAPSHSPTDGGFASHEEAPSPVCVGAVPPVDPPRRALCCYPAKDLLVRPIRAAYPALLACYEARKRREAAGRVVFAFRIEQDGRILRVCATAASTMDDHDATLCMVEAVRKIRYPAISQEERDFCGLTSLNYPVTFEP
jgi:hypothetical protein